MLLRSWPAAIWAELLAEGSREAGSPLQQASGSHASAGLLAAKPALTQMPCVVGTFDMLAAKPAPSQMPCVVGTFDMLAAKPAPTQMPCVVGRCDIIISVQASLHLAFRCAHPGLQP